jgi:hypothetical protein
MRTPTQEQFQIVIDTLTEAYKLAKRNAPVDMMISDVFSPICGTPMCHVGWYASVNYISGIDFTEGSNMIASDLGFRNKIELKEWAHDNPEIWGNDRGEGMFCDGEAFGQEDDTGFTLKTIIDHWKAVKKRALMDTEHIN